MQDSYKHKELGEFLRARRKRLSPQDAGLKGERVRRRTPGLRREEVAALSGISLTWYTSLEQGRPIRVSEQVLESLTRQFRLNPDEKSYLFALAGLRFPAVPEGRKGYGDNISPSLRMILQELHRFPAYVMGSRWDIVAWNEMAGEIFGYHEHMTDLERNVVWRMFIKEEYRQLFRQWEYIAKGMLAQFRNFYGKFADDPWFVELVKLLSGSSTEFRAWWSQHEVLSTPEGSKEMHHPKLGVLYMDYSGFMVAEDQRMVLTVFTPQPGTGTLEKLERLDFVK